MPAVSNTSPILNLAIIGRLSLLHEQFGEVWIPQAVVGELRCEEDLPGSPAVSDALSAGWLRVKEVGDQMLVQTLRQDLDRGEAEAIVLALEVNAEWVLLDERDARRIAKTLGLSVTGVLGVLARAHREGSLPALSEAVDGLRQAAGFWVGDELLTDLLRKAREEDG